MTKDEALRLALEVLADLGMKHYENTGEVLYKNTYTAIKAALEAKDEPVAWMDESRFKELHNGFTVMTTLTKKKAFFDDVAIYTTPPQRTWVGLTNMEIDQGLCRTNYAMQTSGAWRDGVEWAEAKLKDKNTC